MKKHYILIIFLLIPLNFYAHIIETVNMADILPYIDQETLVIFDIDNTIAEPEQTIGSDEWFYYKVQKIMQQKKINQTYAISEAVGFFILIHRVIQLRPIETLTPHLIRFLQNDGIHTIALTARSLPIVQRTIEQLLLLGIDFSRTELLDHELDFILTHPGKYKNGIIFCGENNKGTVLTEILTYANYRPKKIVFIDDKRKNLLLVEHAVTQDHIDFIGIHYTRLEEKVSKFDPLLAEQQFSHFLFEKVINNFYKLPYKTILIYTFLRPLADKIDLLM